MMKVKVFGNQDCVWYEIYAGLMSSMLRIWRCLKWVRLEFRREGWRKKEVKELGKGKGNNPQIRTTLALNMGTFQTTWAC